MKTRIIISAFITLLYANGLFSQVLTYPPSGDNQKSIVSQFMGLVKVEISYHSPDVHTPSGEDRTGEIWGKLVPYGLANLGFGYSSESNPSPWRSGANQNTTIGFSHDVEVQGNAVKAGKYGLFFIPEDGEWTLILSKDYNSWGSYFYNPENDALRVKVMPQKSEYNEYLTYDFDNRKLASCTAILKWENLAVPFEISVPNINDLYIAQMDAELKSNIGFNWENWVKASQFCVKYKTHLDKALVWADFAVNAPYVGERNFTTISNKADVLYAMGKTEESDKMVMEALNESTASVIKIHGLGRQLIGAGRNQLALEVFKFNYDKNKKGWPTKVGLARGYSANGEFDTALKYAKEALKEAPDESNKVSLESDILKLEKGEDIN